MGHEDPTVRMPDAKFHHILGPEPAPAFLEESELQSVWGAKWGAADEFSRLRTVMVRRPSKGLEEVAQLGESAYRPDLNCYLDPNHHWYWGGHELPDLELLHSQWDNFIAAMKREGVEVVEVPEAEARFTKSVFTRDPLFTIPGGAIIGRMAARMRRGEEQAITQTVAAQGLPILGTITGTGLAEGGSFAKVRRDLAFFGTSVRCNAEGYRQLADILEEQGIRLERVSMPGYQIHIDLCLAMLDDDLALVNSRIAPYDFLNRLWELGIETVEVEPDEDWACNLLSLDRRKIFFPAHLVKTAEKLNSKYNVDIIPIEYREMNKNGGGLHCSTMELRRDW
ncbi:dimethylarginine dimethylaminohydrolase family protein [Corynebacterium vitaeruminis]|uniref:dimethylarginine dimethylaminohydrolase family protein n=1 Tax=Corynebacterium vitaeruminis TaxID=38305 RepID=UPI00068E31EA|nr:arginine deiminase family protein [Corynebacterium vitaeruminis]